MYSIKFYPMHSLVNKKNNELKEKFIPYEKQIVRKSSHRKIRPVKYRREKKYSIESKDYHILLKKN